MLTETSKLDLRIPRDREGTFDPKLIARYQRRFPGFDEKIVSMYARGMTVREIQGHLLELYGLEVSPDLDFDGHRRGSGDGGRMAEPASGTDVSAAFFSRRAAGQNPRRGGSFAIRPSMLRLASRRKEPRTSWAFGSRPRKALNSGCAS